jgi:hypothetical protein
MHGVSTSLRACVTSTPTRHGRGAPALPGSRFSSVFSVPSVVNRRFQITPAELTLARRAH